MKIHEILETYSDATLDQLAQDKLDSTVSLRLPRSVVVREVSEAINSLTYVADALASTRPPAYAFLKRLLEADNYKIAIDGFQMQVLEETRAIIDKVANEKWAFSDKNFNLYLSIMKDAWENDGKIDRSEALLLQSLRRELSLWTREHLLLEHHPSIHYLEDLQTSYITMRNRLLAAGIVMTIDDHYILAEEVVDQIHHVWDVDMNDDSFNRLLLSFNKDDLKNFLEYMKLQVAGAKDEKVNRIIQSTIPPSEFLNFFHINDLRDFCRGQKNGKLQVSGTKGVVIENIITYFKDGADLETDVKDSKVKIILPEKSEERELSKEIFQKLLSRLTNDQLYDILSKSNLQTSGNKMDKVDRIIESPWSERSVLSRLRRIDLSLLAKELLIPCYGVKQELINHLIDEVGFKLSKSVVRASLEEIKVHHKPEIDEHLSDVTSEQVEDIILESTKGGVVNNIEEIESNFKFLNHDEHVIMATLRDLKTLNEIEIDRVSRRHQLGWFLTKAHMSEMMCKLNEHGINPVRSKTVGHINVYEWKESKGDETDAKEKKQIIDALRTGVVPRYGLNSLMVGQEIVRKGLGDLISEIKKDHSAFKFLRGSYGAGKTFLTTWLQEHALDEDFITATVTISNDQPLSDLPLFFSGLIEGMRSPQKRDSSSLGEVFEEWLWRIHKKTAEIENVGTLTQTKNTKLTSIVKQNIDAELCGLVNLDPGITAAIKAFYDAKIEGNNDLAQSTLSWICGSHSMTNDTLKRIGVRGHLDANQVFPRIKALLQIINKAGYQGMVMLIDELELIRKFPHKRDREKAYEILRLLIDEAGKDGFPRCLIVLTGTDEFFEDDRAGLKSYEALANRVSSPESLAGVVSSRQPVLELERFNQERLTTILEKVLAIHSEAYNWNKDERVTSNDINKIVENWTSFGEGDIERKPRPVLRHFVEILDLCEENPELKIDDFLKINSGGPQAHSITELLKV